MARRREPRSAVHSRGTRRVAGGRRRRRVRARGEYARAEGGVVAARLRTRARLVGRLDGRRLGQRRARGEAQGRQGGVSTRGGSDGGESVRRLVALFLREGGSRRKSEGARVVPRAARDARIRGPPGDVSVARGAAGGDHDRVAHEHVSPRADGLGGGARRGGGAALVRVFEATLRGFTAGGERVARRARRDLAAEGELQHELRAPAHLRVGFARVASGVSLRGLRAWTPFGPLGLPTFFRGAPVEVDERGDALVAVRVPRVPQPVAHARHP